MTVTALLVLTVVAYAAALALTVLQLRVEKQRRIADADVIWSRMWNRTPEEIRHSLIEDAAEAFSYNRELLRRKASLTNLALIATGAEVLFAGAALIWFRVA